MGWLSVCVWCGYRRRSSVWYDWGTGRDVLYTRSTELAFQRHVRSSASGEEVTSVASFSLVGLRDLGVVCKD